MALRRPTRSLALALGAGLTLLASASLARANMFLTLLNGASVTIIDNGAGDSNLALGQIAYFGPVGSFSTTITIATSNSPGNLTNAIIQISSIDVRNTAAGTQTLTVTVGDTNFANPNGPNLLLQSSYAGTLTGAQPGDSTTFQSFADTSNTQGGIAGGSVTSTALQSYTVVSPTSPQGFSTPDVFAPFSASSPYSMTDVTTITLSPDAQSNVSGTTVITPSSGSAPEPASLALLAPAALALLVRRRRS